MEGNLEHSLVQDIINGRLDEAGPEVDGRRLGLRIITPEGKAGFLEGHQLTELALANTLEGRSLIRRNIVVLKEAILDFGSRHQLPLPSWWGDAGDARNKQSDAQIVPEDQGAGQASQVVKPNQAIILRGRKPKKLERVKDAMKPISSGVNTPWPSCKA